MVKSCWAAGCTNRFVSGGSVTFHVFPKESVLREQWVKAINRSSCTSAKPREPNPHDYVCSEHFQHSDFILSRHARHKRLKKDAVPSLKMEKDEQKDTTRTSQTSQTASAAADPPWEPEAEPSTSLADLVSVEHQYAFDPATMKHKYDALREQLENARQELCNVRRRERRAKMSLNVLLDEVKEMRAVSDEVSGMLEACEDTPVNLCVESANKYTKEEKQFASTVLLWTQGMLVLEREIKPPAPVSTQLKKTDAGPTLRSPDRPSEEDKDSDSAAGS